MSTRTHPRRHRSPSLCWVGVAIWWSAFAGNVSADERMDFFEKRIRPVLVERCFKCHSAETAKPKGGLRLDSRSALLQGGDSGPAIASEKVNDSLILQAILYSGATSEMPPDGKLSDAVIADFRTWLAQGAVFPGDNKPAHDQPRRVDIARGRSFWSFQPVTRQRLPDVWHMEWSRRPLDRFVLEQLEQRSLVPASAAERRELLRRLSFDLRGLPPSFEELTEFNADGAPDALDRWLDRYLASPRYGERWGRNWLDVARYAEDHPTSESTCVPPRFPFRYRDWVIRAWNEDVPYDEQVRRQLAADLLSTAPEEIAALGFLGLSPVYHKEPKLSADVIATIVADEWDERLDTITRGFLGLTVACARCHDHKFDPIRTEDYYALAGVLASTQLVEWPLTSTAPDVAVALTEVQRQIVDTQLRFDYAKKHRDTAKTQGLELAPFEAAVVTTEAELKKLKETPLFEGPIANAVRDAGLWLNGADPTWTYLDYRAGQSQDLPVFIRGNANRHGALVPRRFLEVLSPTDAPRFPSNASGRRELAEALVTDAAPLTARVLVNRVWGWHFGQGLVRTPSNFGRLGDPPSHPGLLDDLAARFIAADWSLKWLHREILSSATWRQSCRGTKNVEDIDPENHLLSRMNRQRLDPEAWRDAVLLLTDQLDAAMYGPSGKLDDASFRRRTVYGVISRQKPASLLKLFDFPDPKQHSERRLLTTTPLQHLYLLNSDFLQQAADELARAVIATEPMSHERRVARLFERVLLRQPTDVELREALELVGGNDPPDADAARVSVRWSVLAHALLATNEFLYID